MESDKDLSFPQTKLVQDSDVCKAMGCYVRAARNALGLSQQKLSELLGVNRTTILRLEKGTAPLRFALCLSAIELLSRLGARSVQIEKLATEGKIPVDTAIDLSVDFASMKRLQSLADSKLGQGSKGAFPILGKDHIPPLMKSPLRKK